MPLSPDEHSQWKAVEAWLLDEQNLPPRRGEEDDLKSLADDLRVEMAGASSISADIRLGTWDEPEGWEAFDRAYDEVLSLYRALEERLRDRGIEGLPTLNHER